jgi:hypothetical protein
MAESCSRVLKKGRVRMTGSCRPGTPAATRPAHAGPEIRTVERGANGAVLEVCCSCGRRTYMHLQWPDAGAPAEPTAGGTHEPARK